MAWRLSANVPTDRSASSTGAKRIPSPLTVGDLGFDPAVFIDDDGKVYGYRGFGEAYMAELYPDTMATVKPGAKVSHNYISGFEQDGPSDSMKHRR